MGKTHEALVRAETEFQTNLQAPSQALPKAVAVKGFVPFPVQAPSSLYQEVKAKLITRFPEESIKTILITSASKGGGSSTTAVNFATTLARDCRLKVLLIDANLRSPILHQVFNLEYNQGLVNLLAGEEDKQLSCFKRVGPGSLQVIPCGKNHSEPLSLFESNHFEKTLKLMREAFDYVILDAPPVINCAESRVMGTKVDGVILVIESGKTRRQVATRVKQELEETGSKILGVILNRRKHYIPEWIYQRL